MIFSRAMGFVIVPLWLASVGWVVAHDVWPAWTAQEPPRLEVTHWLKTQGKQSQFSIETDDGRLGTMWTAYLIDDLAIQRSDVLWIERFPVEIAPFRMAIDSMFTAEGLLDEFTIRFDNPDTRMRLHGERFHADFSLTLERGPDPKWEKTYKVPLVEGGILAGAINPFAQLTGLQVGRRWRVQVFNPLAVLTGLGKPFRSLLVEVAGKGACPAGGGDCFRLKAAGAKAWVDRHGAVLAQEVSLPWVGRLRIVREPAFDEQAYQNAARRWLSRSNRE